MDLCGLACFVYVVVLQTSVESWLELIWANKEFHFWLNFSFKSQLHKSSRQQLTWSITDVSLLYMYLPFWFCIHMDLLHWWSYSISNSLLVIPLLAHTKIDWERKAINFSFKKEAILGEEMLVCLCKSARIQPPHSWMNVPACITSIDSVPVAKKSNSLVPPSLVNHNL